jgi:hypothetical protein
MTNPKKDSLTRKVIYWVIAIALFYVLTSADVSSGIVEVTKKVRQPVGTQEPIVVEKMVTTTKYRTEKVPYGPTRCIQINYNFTSEYEYSEELSDGNKISKCTFTVTNLEDISGEFDFYPLIEKNGNVNDGPSIIKEIDAFGTEVFEWTFTIKPLDTLSCMLKSMDYPKRMKCIYLEPITYQLKEIPYTVEELKNVTEYRIVNETKTILVRENVTKNIYTNKYFGYEQFFYFGY